MVDCVRLMVLFKASLVGKYIKANSEIRISKSRCLTKIANGK